jgi:4-diphosphocytidyl-2-C-methyl-D-erythritol kinase
LNPTVRIGAPAKINLYLHVVGRRPDGYHELDSLAAFAALHDVIAVAPSPDALRLASDGPFAKVMSAAVGDEENLVLRAARLLAAHLGREPHLAIHLHKSIPVAGGLGGGSTDAAATLLALCRLWHVEVPLSVLNDLALRLGADLPICLASRSAFMAGIGERIDSAPDVPPLGVVLVNPRVSLPTAQVFRALDGRFGPAVSRPTIRPGDADSLVAALRHCRNDLTVPAIRLAPVIGNVLAALDATASVLLARMSGSGATCFALYPDAMTAGEAATQIAERHGDWWVSATRLIRSRDELPVA